MDLKWDDKRLINTNRDGNRRPQDPDEEEETMTYQERRPVQYLNTQKGVFDSAFSRGINTAADVFSQTAVFHTEDNG